MVVGLFSLLASQPAHAAPLAQVGCASEMAVSTAAELDNAITCYNAATTPGEYVISLTGDIPLITSTTVISNNLDVSLRIEGNGYSVDGQETPGVRPFEIAPDTFVTMQVITVTQGNVTGNGGGIRSQGTLTLTNSTIISNSASVDTGYSYGGGIFNEGRLTLVNNIITHNSAGTGGGIANNRTLLVHNSTISHNNSTDNKGLYGGGIFSQDTLTITNSTISHNTTNAGFGGGIQNLFKLTLTNSTISHNSYGGIANGLGGRLTIHSSTISHNSQGSGILSSGVLTITNSTISHNTTNSLGGGIYNLGALGAPGTLSISNSTFSHNTGSYGGGIYNNGTLTIRNSTFSHNSATLEGGGINNGGTTTLYNTIIANSPNGGDCSLGDGTINASHSLIGDGLDCVNGANSNNLTGDPQLGPLQDNGGPTFTHALLSASPAIDGGDAAVCADPATVNNLDQRGVIRPQGASCDIGAYEADTGPITFVKRVVGGTAAPSDWTFTLDSDPTPIAPNATITLPVGSYLVTEHGPANYIPMAAAGACALNNGQIELTVPAQGGTCTVTNTQVTLLVNEFFGHTGSSEGESGGDNNQACVWLALSHQPSGPVTISLTPRHGQVTLDKTSITLDGTTWNRFDLAQPDNIFCLQAVDDAVVEAGSEQCKDGLSERFGGTTMANASCGDHLDFVDLAITSSADPNIDQSLPFVSNTPQDLDDNPASIDVLIQDNDHAGIELDAPTPLQLSEGTLQAASVTQATASYQLRLTSQPTSEVTILVNITGNATASPASLTFTPDNWDVFQRVTLTAIDDAIDQGDSYEAQISHSVLSADPNYDGRLVTVLPVSILDDDEAGVMLSPTTLTVTVGLTNTYSVVLASQPLEPVQIKFTFAGPFRTTTLDSCDADDTGALCLTFTPDTWNLPQAIPIFGLAEGSGVVSHQLTSDDPLYTADLAAPLQVTVVGGSTNSPQQPEPGSTQSRLFLPLINK